MVKNVILVRHGLTDWNNEKRFQGHQDVPLNTFGRTQALLTGRHLSRIRIDHIYTSDLLRAKMTAYMIFKFQPQAVLHECEELREGYGAELEGKIFGRSLGTSEIQSLNSIRSIVSHHGENLDAILKRTLKKLTEIVESRTTGETIVVVSHGGPIRLFIGHVMNVPMNEIIKKKIGNCSINHFEYEEGVWHVKGINQIQHLGNLTSKAK